MLQQLLEKAKYDKRTLEIKLVISIICSLIFMNVIIGLLIYLHIALLSFEVSGFLWVLIILSIITVTVLIIRCIVNISYLRDINTYLDDILFRQSLPTKYCYDVTIQTNTLADTYIKHNAKKLRIRYVESRNEIEYKYKLDKKTYHGFVTLKLAKSLFNCEYFKNFY